MTENNYFDRDLSWLSFNDRVLQEAGDSSVPLYERIKFLAIYASNLDEFFRVRVALINRLREINKEKLNKKTELSSPQKRLNEIYDITNKQQDQFGKIIRESILPELQKNNVVLYYNMDYLEAHLAAVKEYFYTAVLSFIQPIIIKRNELKPLFLENKELYIVCDLEKNGEEYIGIINVPNEHLGRFVKLPAIDNRYYYTFIDDVIKQFSNVIFSNFEVKSKCSIKLNRDAELFLDEDFSENIVKKIAKSLNNREIGNPARFLFDPNISSSTLGYLQEALSLREGDSISGGAYHNLFDLFELPNPIGKKLENEVFPALPHRQLVHSDSIFDAIDKKDLFLSFPYQKYNYILRFFNEAAITPSVQSIKATLYRVAKDSHITNALISAARNGKRVSVLVEAKARFDEENNLKWAKKMEDAGVTVVFSSSEIKVHSKVALIERKLDNGKMKKYGFFGTGNFNEKTANIYTDFALLSSHDKLTNELNDTLDFILGVKEEVDLDMLLVSQINLPQQFLKFLDNEIDNANAGKEASIILKLNNLQDKKMIRRLYKAADAGVKIELIIRGICCLIPRKNIRVVRIIDRFLEHARVYIFHNSGEEKILIGSADWMERNLYRRIEVVFPILDNEIITAIKENIQLQLNDNVKAVDINDQIENVKVVNKEVPIRSQYAYYKSLKAVHDIKTLAVN
ncbi:MAG: polyphosphate kinase 1 [Flavobacteriales bacterium]|nr:polyphosphate kinase 1 [Flavobacteriales bacterium]